MEYEYEKDVMKILKMLEYSMKRFFYEHQELLKDATFTEPCTASSISLEELENIGISEQKIDKLFYGVCRKQGLFPYDFMDEQIEELTDDDGEEHITNIHTIRKSKDGKFIKFPTVYWISDVINDIENNKEKTENPELIKVNFDANNFIILNGLTGEFTYNKTTRKLSIRSGKFKLLRKLMNAKNYYATYNEISKLLFNEDVYNKDKRSKSLSDVLDDLKRDLNILPRTEDSNPDCFKNEPLMSYRLELPN